MEHEFKAPLQITWAVDPTLASTTPAPSASPRHIGTRRTRGRGRTRRTRPSSSSTRPGNTSSPRCSPGRRRSRELPAAPAGRGRRIGTFSRRRTEVGPAHRVLADASAQRGRGSTGAVHRGDEDEALVLRAMLQHRRDRRALSDLRRRPSRPDHDLRGREPSGRRRGRTLAARSTGRTTCCTAS